MGRMWGMVVVVGDGEDGGGMRRVDFEGFHGMGSECRGTGWGGGGNVGKGRRLPRVY